MKDGQRRFQVLMCCDQVDAEHVRVYRAHLIAHHIPARLIIDDLCGGAERELAIEHALSEAQLVLVFLSKRSVRREGPLQKAILTALDIAKQKPPGRVFIVPVRLDECETHIRLARLHRVDVFESSGWEKLSREILDHQRKFDDGVQQREDPPSRSAARSMRGPDAKHDIAATVEVPLLTFPRELKEFIYHCMPRREFRRLDEETRRFITTLGCKLEPIIQIAPATPSTLVMGFECLALGAMGENFAAICERCRQFDPGLLRLCLAIAATKSLSYMRLKALKRGREGARNLIFSINLDPIMVAHEHFETFLEWHRYELNHNVIFEINEATTSQSLKKLKTVQVEYELRYAADDLPRWTQDVRNELIDRVEMTKVDCDAFTTAMKVRIDDPHETIFLLRQHKVADRPLVIEGVEKKHIRFLEKYWEFPRMGYLYGQGQSIECGPPWEDAVFPLSDYGCSGGGFIRRQTETDEEDDDEGESGNES